MISYSERVGEYIKYSLTEETYNSYVPKGLPPGLPQHRSLNSFALKRIIRQKVNQILSLARLPFSMSRRDIGNPWIFEIVVFSDYELILPTEGGDD